MDLSGVCTAYDDAISGYNVVELSVVASDGAFGHYVGNRDAICFFYVSSVYYVSFFQVNSAGSDGGRRA